MIVLEDVSKVYKGSDQPVVSHLNLHVERGEICVLVGASGCGKTTTMRMINRLHDATSGKIFVDGKDIMSVNPIVLRRDIGYVIQETGLFPHYTIEKNIATVPKEKRWDKQQIKDRVYEMMKLVDLDPNLYAKQKPSALSGGQKQRVGVARALAGNPPIMLMDEPFGALDPITRCHLQDEFLTNIQAKLKKTIVFVTHDMDEAVKMGDKIAVMQNGGLTQFGTPHEILSHPANEFVESLVGQNRILKKLTLIACNEGKISCSFFSISDKGALADAVKNAPSGVNAVGVTKDNGEPLGYIPVNGTVLKDAASVEKAIVTTSVFVRETDTLYDALSMLFAYNVRYVFSVDENNKAKRLIGTKELFETVNDNGKDNKHTIE